MNTQYNYPNLKKAVVLLDESNYTERQLVAYDKYLDSIRTWNSSMKLSYEEGLEEAENRILSILQDLKSGMNEIDVAKKHVVEVSIVKKFRKKDHENLIQMEFQTVSKCNALKLRLR